MKFCEYLGIVPATLKIGRKMGYQFTKEEAYEIAEANAKADPMGLTHWAWERAWMKLGKPYYDVYPVAIEMMTKVNLDKITGDMLKAPAGLPAVLLRFPDQAHPLSNKQHRARTGWVHIHNYGQYDGKAGQPMLSFALDYGEEDPLQQGSPLFSMRNIPLNDLSLNDHNNHLADHKSLMIGKPMEHELMVDMARLAAMLCLLNNSPELVSMEMLKKDAGKEPTQALHDKAKRRGKFGFAIGKNITVAPHVRRPHLHTYRVGKGRKDAVVKMIGHDKPIIVHRKKIEDVPTGYLDKEQDNG